MNTDDLAQQPREHVAPPTHLFTHDEERMEHIISDEMLMQIAHGSGDKSLEVMMAAIGVASGYAQNLVGVLSKMHENQPIGWWDGFGTIIFVIATTTFVWSLITYRRRASTTTDLLNKIRSRKIGVIAEPGKPYVGGEPVANDPAIAPNAASATE